MHGNSDVDGGQSIPKLNQLRKVKVMVEVVDFKWTSLKKENDVAGWIIHKDN